MLLEHYDPSEYQIEQQILPGTSAGVPYGPAYALPPKLFVIHSTGTIDCGLQTDSVAREHGYFGDPAHQASATFVIDSQHIAQFVPLDQQAWHAARIANRIAWGVELCETTDKAQAMEVIRRGIWLAVHMALTYGVAVLSHHEVTKAWPLAEFTGSTDHVDPDRFFGRHGYSWAEFKANVDALVSASRQPAAPVGQAVPVALPTGETLQGVLSGGTTWVQIGGTWCPLRAWAEALGCHIGWTPPEQGGPHVTITK